MADRPDLVHHHVSTDTADIGGKPTPSDGPPTLLADRFVTSGTLFSGDRAPFGHEPGTDPAAPHP